MAGSIVPQRVPAAGIRTGWKPAVLVGALIALVTGLAYLLTLSPTFTWGDGADIPLRVFDRSDHFFDLTPRDYTLFRAVGRVFLLIPAGDVAYRVNLMTAFFGVLTVLCIYAVVVLRTRDPGAGALAACALAFSHTFWLLAVTAEVYTFAAFLGASVLLLLAAWQETRRAGFLLAAALAAGLGLSHHLAAALLLPGVAVFLWLRRGDLSPRRLAAAAALFAAGALPLLVQIGRVLSRVGPAGLHRFAGDAPASLRLFVHDAVLAAVYLAYQFPGPALVLGLLGMWWVARRRDPWEGMVLATWALITLWAVSSRIPDKYNAYVLCYPLFAILIGLGATPALAWLARRMQERRVAGVALAMVVALLPIGTYAAAPRIAKRLHLDVVHARPCPDRDNDWFFLYPPKNGYDGARRYAESALDAVQPSARIVADYSLWRPLRYLQRVESRRTDVEVTFVEPLLPRIVPFLRRSVAERPTYLATDAPADYYGLDRVRRSFGLEPVGPVFQVVAR